MACCEIYVNDDGLYCCDIKHFKVKDGCYLTFKSANFPPTPLLMEVDQGVEVPAGITIGPDGCTNVFKPGEYILPFDCSAIHGQPAPATGAISLCVECTCPKDIARLMAMQIAELKACLIAGDDGTGMLEVITQLEALCNKLLELINNIGDLSGVAEALADVTAQLEALCDKMEDGFENMQECLEEMKLSLSDLVDGLVKVCEKLDTQTDCLKEIKELLTCPPAIPLGVLTTWK